jgi:hypothetical protein
VCGVSRSHGTIRLHKAISELYKVMQGMVHFMNQKQNLSVVVQDIEITERYNIYGRQYTVKIPTNL